MKEWLLEYYLLIKALHIIAGDRLDERHVLSAAAVRYHTDTVVGAVDYERFCTMERRLLKAIMLPAVFWFGLSASPWSG